MKQTPEAKAFLKRITSLPTGPGISLNDALQSSLDDEAELRKLFAADKTNRRLNDPYVGLVDVFDAPVAARTTRARIVKDDDDLSRKYVMPLSGKNRRKEGTPSMVKDLDEFKKNWAIFTESSLSQLFDWNNVVAAGGAVLACLTPLSEAAKESKRSIRKYYHSAAYPSSDIDLFLWGMDAEQAEKKINTIYEAVRDSVPWDVTCVRTKHTISIHSQYPYRSVQIVLRLYKSPAEILAGFDIDAPCCLYNGERVFANPRAIVAMMRQCNTVDMTRRSPSYEVRLAKYSGRAFEVYVPTLERTRVDPTIYERSIARIEGLARLLVLEKLADTDTRYVFLESRRTLRGRPNPLSRYHRRRRKHNGDLKANTAIGGLEMNDYDVATLHIPYGPGWDARRIDKLVYQTDLGMNSTFNPKNEARRLHRHPAYFGTMIECLEDCCEHCPSPIDADERQLQEEEDKQYIRGRVSFIEEDPGRQSMSGSFKPIDVGEWSGQVYIGETQHFFAAIAAHDGEGVSRLIKKGVDVNRRDHVGRTALHVAILIKASEIACILINAGARMSARLVDGRSALHLAAQLDQPSVVQKLLERSALNQEQANATKQQDAEYVELVDPKADERLSSEDDWSSEDDDVVDIVADDDEDHDNNGERNRKHEEAEEDDDGKQENKKATSAEVSNDDEDFLEEDGQPDILDVNLPDWDLGFTPLAHAVMSGSLPIIEVLLSAQADPKRLNATRDTAFHPLTLTILRKNEDEACKILERLILAGASTSTADDKMRTIFHRALVEDKLQLVSTILRCDPNAQLVLNFPSFSWHAAHFPIFSVIEHSKYAMLALILAHGAKVKFSEEDITKALDACPVDKRHNFFGYGTTNVMNQVFPPVETAIARRDDVAQLLIALGAEVDVGCKNAYQDHMGPAVRKTIFDWVRFANGALYQQIKTKWEELDALSTDAVVVEGAITTWKAYLADKQTKLTNSQRKTEKNRSQALQDDIAKLEEARCYVLDINEALVTRNAKSWNEMYPDNPFSGDATGYAQYSGAAVQYRDPPTTYDITSLYSSQRAPLHQAAMYDELFEACFTGNNDKVQQLCLPVEGKHENSQPLNIFVQVADPSNRYDQTGYTPLYAAIGGRRWNTAKLILAIATAQHRPDEKKQRFTTDRINLDDDSDNESDDSEDSDTTVEQEEPTFVDIANRPSIVQSGVHPKWMLDELKFQWAFEGAEGKYDKKYGNLVQKSVHDGDFEAFVNILNLYKALPLPIDKKLVEMIILKDRVDMLDEFIRRTGVGIDISSVRKVDQDVTTTNDKDKIYRGLSVHGKKRMDLAKMNDPNASSSYTSATTHPLLWEAGLAKAKETVEYLSGGRPLEAYRFYASTSGEEFALLLRLTENLETMLPQWLGWRVTPLGDSPLTAAVLGMDIALVKKLFVKNPRLMASSLHEKVKFIGYNALMIAADVGADTAMIDYLLAKAVSPAERDHVRGWNIYHILCRQNHCDLLDHFLQMLPRDVSEALLAQQSKSTLNTPLHLAVKNAATRATKLIVDFTTTTLLTRDVDGSTALHAAVQMGYSKISGILLAAGPAALHMENGVGETPLEMATLKNTLERTQKFATQQSIDPSAIAVNEASAGPKRINIEALKVELPRLYSMLEQLYQEGRLVKGTKLAQELSKFADMMVIKLAQAKAAESAKPVVVKKEAESQEPYGQAEYSPDPGACVQALSAAPGHRQLIHLIDVQRSVQGNLKRFIEKDKANNNVAENVLKEEDIESQERKESMVLQKIRIHPDNR